MRVVVINPCAKITLDGLFSGGPDQSWIHYCGAHGVGNVLGTGWERAGKAHDFIIFASLTP